MASIRKEALRAFSEVFACAIPALRDRICVGQSDPGHRLEFPHLVIDPIRWTYDPDQARVYSVPAPDRVVLERGSHEGTIKVRIGASTTGEREELEQRVLDVFLGTELRPGIILTDFELEELGVVRCSWELDDDEWMDDEAGDQQFYSSISVSGTIPALRTDVAPTIEEIDVELDTGEPITETTIIP
jgi:hypothetical protein